MSFKFNYCLGLLNYIKTGVSCHFVSNQLKIFSCQFCFSLPLHIGFEQRCNKDMLFFFFWWKDMLCSISQSLIFDSASHFRKLHSYTSSVKYLFSFRTFNTKGNALAQISVSMKILSFNYVSNSSSLRDHHFMNISWTHWLNWAKLISFNKIYKKL